VYGVPDGAFCDIADAVVGQGGVGNSGKFVGREMAQGGQGQLILSKLPGQGVLRKGSETVKIGVGRHNGPSFFLEWLYMILVEIVLKYV
jgi:hypothetical protein